MSDEYYKEFYPTPSSLIRKMFSGIRWYNLAKKSILEPSAGKGDIASVLKLEMQSHNNEKNPDIDTIEINPELQSVLRGKGFRVVYDDFLKYRTYKHYDLIVMNPPFSDGHKHLMKAIEMQRRGGDIICLLNANTIRKPNTIDKTMLVSELNNYNASIEYLSGEFSNAYRSTDVEVALIKISIPPVEKDTSILLDSLRKAKMVEETGEAEARDLTESDFARRIVRQYEFEASAGISIIREYNALMPYLKDSFDDKRNSPILSLTITDRDNTAAYQGLENAYLRQLRYKYWNQLFSSKEITNKFTSNLIKSIYDEVKSMSDYDFSEYNINALRVEMMNKVTDKVEQTILDLFDTLSHKHHWYDEMSNNVHYYNGWKTNKSYIVNKKVILPWDIRDSWSRDRISLYSDAVDNLKDLEKTFQYLDGKQSDSTSLSEILEEVSKTGKLDNVQCKYFKFTSYKKGTLHITFTDLELLKKFNLFGSQKRGWLPPTYGRKHYDEMTKEEQTIIDEFQGKNDYEDVLEKSEYYLSGINTNLLNEVN